MANYCDKHHTQLGTTGSHTFITEGGFKGTNKCTYMIQTTDTDTPTAIAIHLTKIQAYVNW